MIFGTWHQWACAPVALLLAGVLVSCQKAWECDGGAVPIVCHAASVGETKGLAETTTASVQTSGLGLFAWRTDAGTYFDGREPYLENTEFSYDGISAFHASPAAYWPLGSWLNFFAYAPYTADVFSGALRFPSSDYVSGDFPRIQYTPSTTVSSQVDLCLSAPVLDRAASEGVVPLSFTHVLTKVSLQARWTGTDSQISTITAASQSVRIISLSFRNILGTNKLTYGRTSYKWDAPTALEMETLAVSRYDLSVSGGEFSSVALPLAPADYSSSFVNNPEGVLYLLPQALVPGAKIVVTYGIFDSSGGQVGDSETVEFTIGDLPQYIWPAGYEVMYSMTIDLTGGSVIIYDVVFDCNAGAFVSESDVNFNGSDAGSFLGGEFRMDSSSAGNFGASGTSLGGSSAGSFTEE